MEWPKSGSGPGRREAVVVVHSEPNTGNTRRVAEAIGTELEAPVVAAAAANPAMLAEFDLVGLGSGVYLGRLHRELHELARGMVARPGQRVFVFSTSGTCCGNYHDSLRRELAGRDATVVAEFTCPGSDSYRFPGTTLNPGRPDEADIAAARRFARGLRVRADHREKEVRT